MIDKKALIVGTARDCEEGLRATLPRLTRLRESFRTTKFLFVTNDSKDGTERVLREWSADVHDAHIQSVDGLAANVRLRTPRLAVARNLYLAALRQDLSAGINHEILVVLDLDGVNEKLIEEPYFSDAINSAPDDWGGLFANQRDWYYDIWALRHPTWCPTDCWQEVRNVQQAWFNKRKKTKAAIEKFVTGRQKRIAADDQPIRVESAFGGFGIYRTQFLAGSLYTGVDPAGQEICEHVSLNKSIAQRGGGLYILPDLLNDTPQEHVAERLKRQEMKLSEQF
jgi:glycosyltransferase involved in cell wall biosynthesis